MPSEKFQHMETVDEQETGQTLRSYDRQEKNAPEKAKQQHVQDKPGGRMKKFEPSLKWKNLGLTSSYE